MLIYFNTLIYKIKLLLILYATVALLLALLSRNKYQTGILALAGAGRSGAGPRRVHAAPPQQRAPCLPILHHQPSGEWAHLLLSGVWWLSINLLLVHRRWAINPRLSYKIRDG